MNHLPPLHPLRLPASWVARWNELRELDPGALHSEDPDWELLTEDLLHLEHTPTGLVMDVGWYPEASPQGTFKLEVIRGSDWDQPLTTFRTRSLRELSERVEQLALECPDSEPLRIEVEPSVADLAAKLESESDPGESQRLLGMLAEKHPAAAVPILIGSLDDVRPHVRWTAANALRQIGDVSAGPALLNRLLLPETDLDTRRILIRAVGTLRHTPAVPELISALRSSDAQQREAAAWALGALDAREALTAVIDAYATERDEHTKKQLQWTLRRLASPRD